MAGLQRSAVSFRRQGSSGFVWDDRFLTEELNRQEQEKNNNNKDDDEIKELHAATTPPLGSINTVERSRSNGGGRGYRTGKVSPAIEPPSPRLSACGFCAAFGKTGDKTKQPPKHRSRLVDELALVYKEAALRTAREEIRSNIYQILILLQESKGLHFNTAWDKHRSDPDLTTLCLSLSGRNNTNLDTVPSEICQHGSATVQT